MGPESPKYIERKIKQNLNDSLLSLARLREKEGKWKDGTTEDWDDKEWEKGSIIIGEALLCFLYPNVKLKSYGGGLKLSEKIIDEDIKELINFAKRRAYHARPYDTTETSFTDTVALLLSTFSYILCKDSGVPQHIQKKYLDEIAEICKRLVDFLRQSAAHPTKGTTSWAFTKTATYRGGFGRIKGMQLDSTFNTSIVLKALSDAHELLPTLVASERAEIFGLIQGGINALIECYDLNLSFFSRNKTSTEKNVIHSVFALEGLLYCLGNLEEVEVSEAQKNIIINGVEKIIETIGTDLGNLSTYDQDLTWPFAFKIGKEEQSALLEDRSTIGSIANVLYFALRYLPPAKIDDAYSTIDSLIQEFYKRQEQKTKVWVKKEFRIYYTFRMIESLTNSILYRSEQEFSLSKRELSQMLSKALSSDEVVWFITDRLIKEIGLTSSKEGFGGTE